jgi:putative transposase
VTSGVFLSLYVVLDLFSRYAVAWMVAEHENSALAKQLLGEAITRYGIEPGSLIVHNDRGAPMTALGFVSVQPPEKPDHLDQLEIRDRQADHDVIS